MLKRWSMALAGAAVAATAFATPVHAAPAGATRPFYLSLGDSLAQGVQPDSTGQSVPTNQGYADDLYAAAQAAIPNLQLAKLGCPGETTGTMINGGICSYARGSQLRQAVTFLRHHTVAFVTIDIGANDVDQCISGLTINYTCVGQGLTAISTNLPRILRVLRDAAPGVPIIGMTYYDPFAAAWFASPTLAAQSVSLADALNGNIIAPAFFAKGIPVAQVARAFKTDDQTIVPPGAPVDTLVVCAWTWMCAPAPQGPNIHANATGYGVIAIAFAQQMAGII